MGMPDKDQKKDDNFNADLGRAACQALVDAYRNSNDGTVSWSEIDDAMSMALNTLGLPESYTEDPVDDEEPGMTP